MTADVTHLIRSLIGVFVVNRRRGETFLTADAHVFVRDRLTTSGISEGVALLVEEALLNNDAVEVLEHNRKDGSPSRWVRV